jgi:hypothetical protein
VAADPIALGDQSRQEATVTTVHRTAATALLVASLAGTAAPAASATSAQLRRSAHHPRAVYSRQEKSLVPSATPPQAVVQISPSPEIGFDWGDAGIGAAGGIALSMIGLGAALTVSHQRSRRHDPRATSH